jgi:hypothetical protein
METAIGGRFVPANQETAEDEEDWDVIPSRAPLENVFQDRTFVLLAGS